MAKNTNYQLDPTQFTKLYLTGVKDLVEWKEDGTRGAKKGVTIDTANPAHAYDQLSVKIEGLSEPTFIVPDPIPEGLEVKFVNLRVTQYAKRGGGGLALSATADDVKLAQSAKA